MNISLTLKLMCMVTYVQWSTSVVMHLLITNHNFVIYLHFSLQTPQKVTVKNPKRKNKTICFYRLLETLMFEY